MPTMEIFTFSLSLLTLAVTLFLIVMSFSAHLRRRKAGPLPPGPLALPIIGHLHLIGPAAHLSFHALSQRYGPIISLRLGSTPAVVVADADNAAEFFRTHDLDFANRPQTNASRRFAYDSAGFAFAPYGPYWRFVRKVCMTELLGGRTLQKLLPLRQRELVDMLAILLEGARRGEAVDVSRELIRMTNNNIARMTTSRTCAPAEGEEEVEDPEEAMKLVKLVTELIGSFNATDHVWILRGWDLQGFNRRIGEVHRRFDAMMERIIRQKEEARRGKGGGSGGMKDLLDILLDVSEDENADVRLTRENIKGIVLDIFTAGSDSSATTVEWALAELINHPAMLSEAWEEVDRVVGRDRLVEETDVAALPYLQAVVKETFRLHPAAVFAQREAARDVLVGGYRIRAGTNLFVNIWSVGKDPKQWEDPLEFRPERFLGQQQQQGQHFPFGGGRRICPGAAMAHHVVHTTLAALLQCFEWGRVGRLDMEEGLGLVVPRARGLVCVPVSRLDPLPAARG